MSKILKEVQIEILMSIHTEYPSLFLELIDERATRIKLAKEGESIDILNIF